MTTTTVDSKKSNNFFDMSHLFCLSTYNRGVSLHNLGMTIQNKTRCYFQTWVRSGLLQTIKDLKDEKIRIDNVKQD